MLEISTWSFTTKCNASPTLYNFLVYLFSAEVYGTFHPCSLALSSRAFYCCVIAHSTSRFVALRNFKMFPNIAKQKPYRLVNTLWVLSWHMYLSWGYHRTDPIMELSSRFLEKLRIEMERTCLSKILDSCCYCIVILSRESVVTGID